MKEKLAGALGGFGIILWYLFSFIFCFAPLLFLKMPFIVRLLAIGAILFLPLIGEIIRCGLYVWVFFVVISEPIDVFSIIFFICLVIYVFAFGMPLISTIFGLLGGRHRD